MDPAAAGHHRPPGGGQATAPAPRSELRWQDDLVKTPACSLPAPAVNARPAATAAAAQRAWGLDLRTAFDP